MRFTIFFMVAAMSATALRAQSIQWNFGTSTPTAAPVGLRLSYGAISSIADAQNNGLATIESQQTSNSGDYFGASGGYNLRLCTKVGGFNLRQSSYISFTITPNSGQKVPDLTGFQVGMRAGGGSRPTNWTLLASTDGFATHAVLSQGTTGSNNQWNQQSSSFIFAPDFGETVTMRLYFYGNSGNQPASNTPTLRIDDLSVFNAEALNVNLTQFSAAADQSAALLKWTTAEEKNNAFFEIEHSLEGIKFQSVGMMKGAGNATTASTYQFRHLNTTNGINFYRLRAVDFNGNMTTSPIQSVVIQKNNLKIYPTLASDVLTIENGENLDQTQTYEIVGLNGQKFKFGQFLGQTAIEIGDLPQGTYVVRVNRAAAKFVKQ